MRGETRAERISSAMSEAKANMAGRCPPTALAGRPSTWPTVVSTRYGPACRTEPAWRPPAVKRSATVPGKRSARSPGDGRSPLGKAALAREAPASSGKAPTPTVTSTPCSASR